MNDARSILLAEDNAHDVELTLAALEQHGFARQAVVVNDGDTVLDYLARRGSHANRPAGLPCVVLLDVKMPRGGGLEILRAIKSDETLRMIPVVMLTSSREEHDLRRSYELGANGYLVKPADFTQFSEALRHFGQFWCVTNEPPPGPAPR